jgi:hypothetical protein
MRPYRVVLIDGRGEAQTGEDIEAASDLAAESMAREILDQRSHYAGVEIWQRSRLVSRHARTAEASPVTISGSLAGALRRPRVDGAAAPFRRRLRPSRPVPA